ncbi:hypothetical protein [Adlercreutzia mucosicola]|uniref:hypothetical protein n=1 Tax=Adlercreutzia mucosicola TaxID=580026 RepID=UPI000417D342|nr:hypothetical protein [Adlercreutzia mucosicola]MCR2035893.1 hypothetical protein [Adlercreutzia mucosicola]
MALYITATVEDLTAYEGLNCFSKAALAAIIDWYDADGTDEEVDPGKLRGEWTEYRSAADMWNDYHYFDKGLPTVYEPDQLEDLVTAIEDVKGNVIQTESGTWLVQEL